jgi:hypothetical protein
MKIAALLLLAVLTGTATSASIDLSPVPPARSVRVFDLR